jgi:hypothetical protein
VTFDVGETLGLREFSGDVFLENLMNSISTPSEYVAFSVSLSHVKAKLFGFKFSLDHFESGRIWLALALAHFH